MNEITYRITKYDGNHGIKTSGDLTESELKRRLSSITGWPDEGGIWEREIAILLHGDGEKGEEVHDHIPLRGLSIEEIKRKYPKEYADAITEAEDDQPSPTRAAWEAWFDRSPFNHNAWVMEWFKAMPIVPKE